MNQQIDQEMNEPLDRLIRAANTNVPSDTILHESAAKLHEWWQSTSSSVRTSKTTKLDQRFLRRHSRSFVTSLSVAATVMILLSLVFWGPFAPRLAFAQVQERLRAIQSAKMTIRFQNRPHLNAVMKRLANGDVRNDFEQGITQVYDSSKGVSRAYDLKSQTTWLMKSPPMGQSSWDFIELLLSLDTSQTTSVGRKFIHGVECQGFQAEPSNNSAIQGTIWVDMDTRLPRQIEQNFADRLLSSQNFLIDFEYDCVQPEEVSQALPLNFAEVESGPVFPQAASSLANQSHTVLRPGSGIGPISFQSSVENVLENYGPASDVLYYVEVAGKTEVRSTPSDDLKLIGLDLVFSNYGLRFHFDETKHLTSVQVDSHLQRKPLEVLQFQTANGIGINSLWDDVVAKLGTPSARRGEATDFAVVFERIGLELEITNQRVSLIALRPSN